MILKYLKDLKMSKRLKRLIMDEETVMERSRKDPEREWSWLLDGLPMRHRVCVESRCGFNWLKVAFVDSHKKSWSTEKYLVRDMLLHKEDYRKAVEAQCAHAMAEMRSNK